MNKQKIDRRGGGATEEKNGEAERQGKYLKRMQNELSLESIIGMLLY